MVEFESYSESYRAAGVDVTAGYRAVEMMKSHVERTRIPGVMEGIGGFGGLFMPDLTGIKEPVLVSGTDGVGTKLQIAQQLDVHGTIGIDCVAMCANDIVCAGARPLFFLDYIAIGKNVPERVAEIVKGVADGCEMAGCALIGGETAEHPGIMPDHEYDIAGFCVGIADKSRMLDKNKVREGDAVIGLASSGVHSNGFSLVRKVLADKGISLSARQAELGCTVGEALLVPTRIYVQSILRLLEAMEVKSVSHITGGGFYENIPRSLPHGLGAVIERSKIQIPPIFSLIGYWGGIPERDMFNTFNMGVGMSVIVAPERAADAVAILKDCGERASVIGEVRASMEGLVLA